MSGIGKIVAGGARKVAGGAAKTAAKAAGSAARTAAKKAVEKAPDFETSSKWLIRVVTGLPKYLRLYFCLLTDNRVSSKAKVVLMSAIAALGAHFAFGGILFNIQSVLGYILGPFAFVPTVLILLITLDICYTLISADVLGEYEKRIFGEGNSLESDVKRLRDYLGSAYTKFKSWWQTKADRTEADMEKKGIIVGGRITDAAIQEVADQIVELETSGRLQQKIEANVKHLKAGDEAASKTLRDVEQKLLK